MKTFAAGFLTCIALCAALQWAFPAASVPPRLRCGMRTADGCALWFDPVRVERFKQGRAGTSTYGNLLTGAAAQSQEPV